MPHGCENSQSQRSALMSLSEPVDAGRRRQLVMDRQRSARRVTGQAAAPNAAHPAIASHGPRPGIDGLAASLRQEPSPCECADA